MPRGGARPGAGRPRKPLATFPETTGAATALALAGATQEMQDAHAAAMDAAALEGGARRMERIGLGHAVHQSPRQVLVTIMRFWLQEADREAKKKGKARRQSVLFGAVDRAGEAARYASPYYHARLSAVAIAMGGTVAGEGPGAAPVLEDVPYQVVITQDEAAF